MNYERSDLTGWIQNSLPQRLQSQTLLSIAEGIDNFINNGLIDVIRRFKHRYNVNYTIDVSIDGSVIVYHIEWSNRMKYFGDLTIGKTEFLIDLNGLDYDSRGILTVDVNDKRVVIMEMVDYFDMIKVFTDFVHTACSEVIDTVLNASAHYGSSQTNPLNQKPQPTQHLSATPQPSSQKPMPSTTEQQIPANPKVDAHSKSPASIPTQMLGMQSHPSIVTRSASAIRPNVGSESSKVPSTLRQKIVSPQQTTTVQTQQPPTTVNKTPSSDVTEKKVNLSMAMIDEEEEDEPEHIKVSTRNGFNRRSRKISFNLPSFGPDSQKTKN